MRVSDEHHKETKEMSRTPRKLGTPRCQKFLFCAQCSHGLQVKDLLKFTSEILNSPTACVYLSFSTFTDEFS